MADMNFGVNLLPVSNKSNSLGSSSKKWNNVYVDKINGLSSTALNNGLSATQSGIAIIVSGDRASMAVPVGGYAYIKDNTHGLAEGLYTNTSSAAFPASGGTADSTVFTAVSGGGLNAIQQSMAIKTIDISITTNSNGTAVIPNTIIDPNTTILIGIKTDDQGYYATYTIIDYNGALAYKIKIWDSSGATMQVDANRTSSITVYYRNY